LRQVHKIEAIGTLAGGIAHDFNNILTPILGYAGLLTENLPSDSEDADNALQIVNAGNRAKDLVRQILTFSRESEQQVAPHEIHPEIKEALKFLEASLPASIEIKQKIDTDCGAVLVDPTQIHQIVMNLCTNAYHAMRDDGGGMLGVTLSRVELAYDAFLGEFYLAPGPYLMLEVSDSGHGMDKSVIEKIFDPYFTTKAQGDGTGLGMSVVHGIIKSLGGHITVYSEKGEGTTFRVYLPCFMDGSTPEAEDEILPLPHGNETILMVDDQQVIVEMVELMLKALGYTMMTYTDSRKALDAFKADPDRIQLVITDMAMPYMQGDELARKILEIRPEIPVILCTGFSEILNEEKAKLIGIKEYIMKPIVKKDLAMLVRRVLDSPQQGD
jgi:CheY-like chemotaxis protein